MIGLGAPLVVAELGWMAMGVVDTIMAGPLGAGAVGAGSLGHMLFYPVVTWGIGVLLGMDTLVAQSFGAKNLQDTRHTLVNGVPIRVDGASDAEGLGRRPGAVLRS